MLSCICLEPEEEGELPQNVDSPLQKHHAYPPTAPSSVISETDSPRTIEKRRLRDKIVIYTGALGSKDLCDDSDYHDDQSEFSEDGFEYQSDDLFAPVEGQQVEWKWPKDYRPLDSILRDAEKLDAITEVQRRIGVAPKNYMKMAKMTNFSLDKHAIVRYLEGNQWKVDNVAERIIETIEWRVSFGLPTTCHATLRTELATGKFFCHGFAKDGRPVVYMMLGNENTWSAEGNTATVIYTLERAIESMQAQVTEAVYIIDCEGVGLTTAPATAFVSQLISVIGKHYPRRMGQIFICNVSSVFYFIWNVVSLSLAEMTVKKIQILTDDIEEMKTRMGEFVALENLHPKYGGSAEFSFHVDSYLRQHRKLVK
mmetsp:Transcript_15539/g.25891  ORF Transcript_15539/g.25891 Transcript_15539/m.25891 type:complete len:369 (+) Transcript_15539:60-1166(+)